MALEYTNRCHTPIEHTPGHCPRLFSGLLPDGVGFVVSDRGVHFTAHAFRTFTQQQGFMHGPISRRRPQTNGIAERMVRTLKEWLRQQTWQTSTDLEGLLSTFVGDYNDRPHQGLALRGLSPNEYAQRLLGAA